MSARVTRVQDGGDGCRVVTWETPHEERTGKDHQETPCKRCPWRRDAPVGAFPPDVFRSSARTAYDQATHRFGCHASQNGKPLTCAGFLLRGAAHNIAVRMDLSRHGIDYSGVHSPVELYDSYREMAIANGVDPDDPALARCRDDAAAVDYQERVAGNGGEHRC